MKKTEETKVDPKVIWRGVLRKRSYEVRNMDQILSVVAALSKENHTGTITVNMAQGGINGIVAEDRVALHT